MTLALVGVLAVLGLVVLVRVEGWRVAPFHLTLAILVLAALGAQVLRPGSPTALVTAAGVTALLCGYLLARGGARPSPPADAEARRGGPTTLDLRPAIAVAAALTIYHFSKIGIPLLSAQVETTRFDFSSGLLGLPGRTYLYVLPLLALVALREQRAGRVSTAQMWVALSLFLGTRVASGFKGALIEVLTVLVISRATSPGGLSVALAVRRYVVPVTAAAVFALGVAQLYATTGATGRSGLDALVHRATVGTAEAGVLSLERGAEILPGRSAIAADVRYVAWKYAGIGAGPRYAYSQLVSTRMYRTPLRPDSFIVPVTIGAFPVLQHDVGVPGALLGMLLAGWGYARVQRRACCAATWAPYLGSAAGLLLLHSALTKGDLVYSVVNWVLMAAVTWALVRAGSRSRPEPSTAPLAAPPVAVGVAR